MEIKFPRRMKRSIWKAKLAHKSFWPNRNLNRPRTNERSFIIRPAFPGSHKVCLRCSEHVLGRCKNDVSGVIETSVRLQEVLNWSRLFNYLSLVFESSLKQRSARKIMRLHVSINVVCSMTSLTDEVTKCKWRFVQDFDLRCCRFFSTQ